MTTELMAEKTLRERGWKRKDARAMLRCPAVGKMLRALERGERIPAKRAAAWMTETALEAAWIGFCQGHSVGYDLGVEIMQREPERADPLDGLTWEDLSEMWDDV